MTRRSFFSTPYTSLDSAIDVSEPALLTSYVNDTCKFGKRKPAIPNRTRA
jgi:hypothetical protein